MKIAFPSLHTPVLNLSCQVGKMKVIIDREMNFPFPLHRTDFIPTSKFFYSTDFSLSLALFSPFNTPVAFLKVPRDARGCRETPVNTGSLQSLHQASPAICLW